MNRAKLILESKLELTTRRILNSFQTIRFHERAYAIRASGLNEDKRNGFTSFYQSQEGKFFAENFITSTVAAYFDGLAPRQANVFGRRTANSSVDNAVKKRTSGGEMATANRFKERMKKTPEFLELQT